MKKLYKIILIIFVGILMIGLYINYNIINSNNYFTLEMKNNFEELYSNIEASKINKIEYKDGKIIFNNGDLNQEQQININNEITRFINIYNLYSIEYYDNYLFIYINTNSIRSVYVYSKSGVNYNKGDIIYKYNSIVEKIINKNWFVIRYCENRSICPENKFKITQ